jgi:hypothetical protein
MIQINAYQYTYLKNTTFGMKLTFGICIFNTLHAGAQARRLAAAKRKMLAVAGGVLGFGALFYAHLPGFVGNLGNRIDRVQYGWSIMYPVNVTLTIGVSK